MTEDLTLEEAALVFVAALRIIGRMEDEQFEERAPSAAVPRDVLCVGEARLLIPAAAMLLSKAYPDLLDEDALETILRDAKFRTAVN